MTQAAELARAPEQRAGLRIVVGGVPVGAILGGIALLGGLAIRLLRLDKLGFVFCTFKAATGLPCMTCGGTRTLGLLARGDLAGALAMNPLVAAGFFVLVPWAVTDFILWTRGRALGLSVSSRVRSLLLTLGAVALLVNWAYLIVAGR